MVIVFSGYNPRAVIALVRTLEKNNVKYAIIAAGDKDSIHKTIYNDKVIYNRRIKKIDLEEILNAIDHSICIGGSILLAPTTEYLNRFFLNNRAVFERHNCFLPLVSKQLYELISDKESFTKLCINNSILVPNEFNKIECFTGKIVVKPKSYISSDGNIYSPFFISSMDKFNHFFSNHNKDDFILQEYLDGGESYYLLFYFSKSGEVLKFSQKNLAQQCGGKSMVAAVSADYHLQKELVDPYINMLKRLGFTGLIMIENRRYHGKDYMIEANPRFWGPTQLYVDAGCRFIEQLLFDYGELSSIKEVDAPHKSFYYWSGGITGDSLTNSACVWYDNAKFFFRSNYDKFIKADIYKRGDTMDVYYIERLNYLYLQESKHSNYQIIADPIAKLIDSKELKIVSRQEKERLIYIEKKVNLTEKTVLDIGGNTGYFTFEVLEKGAKSVDYYEGNKAHAEFVEIASKLTNVSDKINVHPEYFLFGSNKKTVDVALNLNVVHHLGDDFGSLDSMEEAKKEMLICINNMASFTYTMIFQMGFNWKGDRKKCLFEHGTKAEMIEFINEGTKEFWQIESIGMATKSPEGNIIYEDLNEKNLERDDSLGEFLNRPIFIMKSRIINILL